VAASTVQPQAGPRAAVAWLAAALCVRRHLPPSTSSILSRCNECWLEPAPVCADTELSACPRRQHLARPHHRRPLGSRRRPRLQRPRCRPRRRSCLCRRPRRSRCRRPRRRPRRRRPRRRHPRRHPRRCRPRRCRPPDAALADAALADAPAAAAALALTPSPSPNQQLPTTLALSGWVGRVRGSIDQCARRQLGRTSVSAPATAAAAAASAAASATAPSPPPPHSSSSSLQRAVARVQQHILTIRMGRGSSDGAPAFES
jgi:hypothetical protein